MSWANASLVIAGDGDESYRKELEEVARAFGIAENVCWAGFLSGSAKAAAFAAADIFVLPSYSENFGNAVVEALIAGVPVIVSDRVGICRELLERNAALVVPCDSNAICAAISRLFSSPEEAATVAIQGQRAARELFSEDSVIKALLNCYYDILARSAGRDRKHVEAGATALRSN